MFSQTVSSVISKSKQYKSETCQELQPVFAQRETNRKIHFSSKQHKEKEMINIALDFSQ